MYFLDVLSNFVNILFVSSPLFPISLSPHFNTSIFMNLNWLLTNHSNPYNLQTDPPVEGAGKPGVLGSMRFKLSRA